MRQGQVQQCDAPQVIFDRPANRFVAGYIGSPPMNFIRCELVEVDGAFFLTAPDLRLRLPEEMTDVDAVRSRVGGPVIFGVRPTDVHDASLPGPAAPTADNTLDTLVEVVEPMGAESMVYLRAGEHSLVASLDSATCAQEGRPLRVVLNMGKCHLFDARTDETIV
ncbi:MAG: TOBE domain-containing protein, partial [Armatimonadota bacterium]